MASLKEKIRIALGDGMADLLIRNGRVVDVFSGQIEKKDVAVFGGMIIGFGDYQAREVMSTLNRAWSLCPNSLERSFRMERPVWSSILMKSPMSWGKRASTSWRSQRKASL